MKSSVLIIYVPTIHDGYEKLFKRLSEETEEVFILDEDLISEFTGLHKEIRALRPERARYYVALSGYFVKVSLLNRGSVASIKSRRIVVMDDQLCRGFAKKYLAGTKLRYETVFLRHDKNNVFSQKPINCSRVSTDKFDRQMMALAHGEAKKSSDWWRRVGAVLVRDGKVLLKSYNRHVPSEHMPYIDGDPRDFIKAGERSELCSAFHSESSIITKAANEGLKLSDGETYIYVSVFPCPMCAMQIAYSGVRRCYFGSGHASLRGEDVLKSQSVEIILVK